MKTFPIILRLLIILAAFPISDSFGADFSHAISLKLDGYAPIYRMTLPQDVYGKVARSDLGDIRIVNDSGDELPYVILHTDPSASAISTPAPVPLPFFPLYSEKWKEIPLSPYIRIDGAGSIIESRMKSSVESERAVVYAYLIDMTALAVMPSQLELTWLSVGEDLAAAVSIEYSNDLTHWESLIVGAPISEYRIDSYRLIRNTIDLPCFPMNYLRMSWTEGRKGLRLRGIKAMFLKPVLELSREEFRISPEPTGDPSVYVFDAKGVYPVDRIHIRLPKNCLIDAVIQSRADKESPWEERWQGVMYKLYLNGEEFISAPVWIKMTNDRYWRLDIRKSSYPNHTLAPVLELSWTPHELYFFGRGSPPFRLMFGNSSASPLKPAPSLIKALKYAHEGEFIQTAYPDKRMDLIQESPVPRPFAWKLNVLRGVWLTGVLLTGWLFIKLLSARRSGFH